MEIRRFTDSDRHTWDTYVLAHPDGYAYHRCAWKDAVERAYGFDGIYLMAEEGGRLGGVLPLVDFKLPLFGRTLVSLPYCDVGGILADDDQIAAALQDHAVRLAHDLGARGLELRNGRKQGTAPDSAVHKVRMLLELPESSDALLAGLKAKLRSQVKKPLRDGLTATLGGAELGEEFYRVFCENMRDLGSPVHSFRWVQAILAAYGEQARVGMVRLADGTPAAAGIILLHGDKVSIPWASALRRYNRWNPNMLLYWTFLAFAADHDYCQFDFGRSTPEEGTYRFKEQWGARPQPLFWYDPTTPERDAGPSSRGGSRSGRSSSQRRLVANLWSQLPETGANWLGPRIRKYISL
jgi:FemAB-related protein (PEP-CTERM system-associated)